MHVRKIVRRVIEDDGLDIANPFARVKIETTGKSKRATTTEAQIAAVVEAMKGSRLNVELRCLILSVIDTGAGPKELCLLEPENIRLDAPIPHILTREDEGWTSKTAYRERESPLVRHALEDFKTCPEGFPRCRRDNGGEAVSAAANKFLRPLTGKTSTPSGTLLLIGFGKSVFLIASKIPLWGTRLLASERITDRAIIFPQSWTR